MLNEGYLGFLTEHFNLVADGVCGAANARGTWNLKVVSEPLCLGCVGTDNEPRHHSAVFCYIAAIYSKYNEKSLWNAKPLGWKLTLYH